MERDSPLPRRNSARRKRTPKRYSPADFPSSDEEIYQDPEDEDTVSDLHAPEEQPDSDDNAFVVPDNLTPDKCSEVAEDEENTLDSLSETESDDISVVSMELDSDEGSYITINLTV